MKKKVELVNNHHQSISYAREGYRTLKISIKNEQLNRPFNNKDNRQESKIFCLFLCCDKLNDGKIVKIHIKIIGKIVLLILKIGGKIVNGDKL